MVTTAQGQPVDVELEDGVPGGVTAEAERQNLWPEQATPALAGPARAAGRRMTIHRGEGRHGVADQGRFLIHFHFPGYLLPEPTDHGHHGLAAVAESFLAPDTWIRLHEHRNDEIISWVPAGVMRHDDQTVGELVTDAGHLMVMNAGASFWHEERTLPDDPPLRMLQLFVRPHTVDLPPGIQHGPVPAPVTGRWRHLFGPPAGDGDATVALRGRADASPIPSAPDATGDRAPFTVRNGVHLYDIRLGPGDIADLPRIAGWHTWFHIFEGAAAVDGERFTRSQSGLITDDTDGVGIAADTVTDTAADGTDGSATGVLFLIDPAATVTRVGTVAR